MPMTNGVVGWVPLLLLSLRLLRLARLAFRRIPWRGLAVWVLQWVLCPREAWLLLHLRLFWLLLAVAAWYLGLVEEVPWSFLVS